MAIDRVEYEAGIEEGRRLLNEEITAKRKEREETVEHKKKDRLARTAIIGEVTQEIITALSKVEVPEDRDVILHNVRHLLGGSSMRRF